MQVLIHKRGSRGWCKPGMELSYFIQMHGMLGLETPIKEIRYIDKPHGSVK